MWEVLIVFIKALKLSFAVFSFPSMRDLKIGWVNNLSEVKHLTHNGMKRQILIVLNSKFAVPSLEHISFLKKMVRKMAISCINYSLKALWVLTFKAALIGQFLMLSTLTESENFPQKEVIAHWLCEFLCSPIYNVHILNLKITGKFMAPIKTLNRSQWECQKW